MKKSLIALAVLGAIAGTASAQSSVTLYGVVDLAVRNVKNDGAGSVWSMVSGANQTSRIGFRGQEDLGGGLFAGFMLESGINVDSGTMGTTSATNQFWDRAAYLNLRSNNLGEVRFGRDLTPVYSVWSAADPFGQVGVASVVALYPASTNTPGAGAAAARNNPIFAAFGTNDRTSTTTTRNNNMVIYFTPNTLGGFNGTVFAAPGEANFAAPNSSTAQKQAGFTLGYANAKLSVRGGYAQTEIGAFASDNKFKDRALHAIYDFGLAKASIAQRQYKWRNATQEILQVGLWVPVGSQGTIKASYGRLNNKGTVGATSIESNDARLWGLGYQHDLSKRTSLYGSLGRVSNTSPSNVAISGGQTTGYPLGGKSTGMEVGLRHIF